MSLFNIASDIFFVTVALAWCLTANSSTHLLNLFRQRYYDEAEGQIPYAHASIASPWKAFYFLSSKSKYFLEQKKDSELLRLRLRFKILFIFSLLYPIIAFATIALMCFTLANK